MSHPSLPLTPSLPPFLLSFPPYLPPTISQCLLPPNRILPPSLPPFLTSNLHSLFLFHPSLPFPSHLHQFVAGVNALSDEERGDSVIDSLLGEDEAEDEADEAQDAAAGGGGKEEKGEGGEGEKKEEL